MCKSSEGKKRGKTNTETALNFTNIFTRNRQENTRKQRIQEEPIQETLNSNRVDCSKKQHNIQG